MHAPALAAADPTTTPPRETQETIMAWKRATFGPSTPLRTLAGATEELSELFRKITSDAPPAAVVEEAADVALLLCDIGEWLGASDWLFGVREPRLYRPVRLTGYALTQIGLLVFDVELIVDGDPSRSQSIALRNLRAVLGALRELSSIYGQDLRSAIDAKMAINRTRKWELDGTGHGYHRGAAR